MFRSPFRRALLVSALALAALVAVQGSAGAFDFDDDDRCPTYPWPWPWPDGDPTDDAIRQDLKANVRWDEFNPAPHWDGGAELADVACVVAR